MTQRAFEGRPSDRSLRRSSALGTSLLVAGVSLLGAVTDGASADEWAGLEINCWRDFETQVGTFNSGPFRDDRDGSCPEDEDWARVADGLLTGYLEGTFDVPPGECVDLVFHYLNDGDDGGSLTLSVNDMALGSMSGSGHHLAERCETIVFHHIPNESGVVRIKVEFSEKSPDAIRHNGAVWIKLQPAAELVGRTVTVTGEPRRGATIEVALQGNPACERGRQFVAARGFGTDEGYPFPDRTGRNFPVDSPYVFARGRLDARAAATVELRLPNNPNMVGETCYIGFLSFIRLPDKELVMSPNSQIAVITILP